MTRRHQFVLVAGALGLSLALISAPSHATDTSKLKNGANFQQAHFKATVTFFGTDHTAI